MKAIDALARYLWEQGLGVSTTPWAPPGHLVVRDGDYTRLLLPHEVEAMAAALPVPVEVEGGIYRDWGATPWEEA